MQIRKITKFLIFVLLWTRSMGLQGQNIFSNTSSSVLLTVERQVYVSDSIYEFDVYIKNIGTTNRYLAGFGLAFTLNNGWRNGGIMNTSSFINGVFYSPHSIIKTNLTNALNGYGGGSMTTLARVGDHFKFNNASLLDTNSLNDNVFYQVPVLNSKIEGIVIAPNDRILIGRLQLVNTTKFNKLIGPGLRIEFFRTRNTQIFEDTVIMGNLTNLTNTRIYYQLQNAIVKSQTPNKPLITYSNDTINVNFDLVNRTNGFFTGNYDSSATVNNYVAQIFDTNNNFIKRASNTTTPIKITSLPSGYYRVKIAAVNIADTSDYSVYSDNVMIIKNNYIISSVVNGIISNTSSPILLGQNVQITYQSNHGYVLDSIYINGISINTTNYLNSYIFRNVQGDSTIKVVFKLLDVPSIPADTIKVCINSTIAYLKSLYPTYNWYNVKMRGAILTNSTLLQNGYYYASQIINGIESNSRDSVYISILNVEKRILRDTSYCGIATIANINGGNNVVWYSSNNINASTLLSSTALQTQKYYYATISNGCYSAIDSISVSILAIPLNIITLKDTIFCSSATIANLYPNRTNLIWYDNNSQNATALLSTAQLSNTTYYYAVKQQCISDKKTLNVKVVSRPIRPVISSITGADKELVLNIDGSQDSIVSEYIVIDSVSKREVIRSTVPTIIIADLTNETRYSYVVLAVNCAGLSDTSLSVSGVPTNNAISINTYVNDENAGTITPSVVINKGGSYRITFTSNIGYQVDSIFVNNVSIKDSVNGYTFNNVVINQEIRVVFKIQNIRILSSSGKNGYISVEGEIYVPYGSDYTVTFKPRFAYSVDSIVINGIKVDTVDKTQYTFRNVTSQQSIYVNFKKTSYFIRIAGSDGGTISPQGDIQVSEGFDRQFTLRSNGGYKVEGVLLDGVKQNVDSTNIFVLRNIRKDHFIAPLFSLKILKIEAISGIGGKINPEGTLLIQSGQTVQYLIQPDNGYKIDSIFVDGIYVVTPSNLLYSFVNVTNNHIIKVTYKQDVYKLTSSSNEGGTISPNGVYFGKQGDSVTYTIRANNYYIFDSLLLNGRNIKVGNTLQYKIRIVAEGQLKAIFKKQQYTITSRNVNGVGLNFVGNRVVKLRDSVKYTVYSINGNTLDSLVVDGVRVSGNSYTFREVNADHSIVAYYSTKIIAGLLKKTDGVGPYQLISSSNVPNTISPDGISLVDANDSVFYTIDTTNYGLDSVIIDNVYKGKLVMFSVKGDTNHVIRAVLSPKTYTISSSTNDGGIINPLGNVILDKHSDFVYNIIPNTNYVIDSLIVDGVKITNTSTYRFTDITSNHVIRVVFKLNVLSIDANNSIGGILTPSGRIYVNQGQQQQIRFIPNDGYIVDSVFIDGIYNKDSTTAYTFRDIITSHTMYVKFKAEIYTIISSTNLEHALDPHGITIYNKGANGFYDIVYLDNYKLDSLLIDGVLNTDSIESYTFYNLNANHTIRVIMSYTLHEIVSSGDTLGGTISPFGRKLVSENTNQAYIIKAKRGYIIDSVIVDNKPISIKDSIYSFTYTFTNVVDSHTIRAKFKGITYKVSAIAGVGGKINPQSDSIVNYGSTANYVITANTGYIIDSLIVNGRQINLLASNSYVYSFTNILGDSMIKVTFKTIKYKISSIAGVGGTISPLGDSMVNSGGSVNYTITANTGYVIDSVIVNGRKLNLSAGLRSYSYKFINIVGDSLIQVRFKEQTFTITSSTGTGGSINPLGVTTVKYGAKQTYTFTASGGNGLDSLIVDGTFVTDSTTSYTFNNIVVNHTIRVTFKVLCGVLTEAPVIVRTSNMLGSSIEYASYIWNVDGTVLASSNKKTITPAIEGVYTLQGVNNVGCLSAVSKKYYYAANCIIATGRLGNGANIQGNIIGNADQIIINWCTEVIKDNVIIRVVDINGAEISETSVSSQIGTYILNKQSVPAKKYIVQVIDSKGDVIQISDVITN